ncbi:MAG TPA: HEAT repeat domain-containing protein [Acidobacteriaceae bacterium]|jgi:HEAT repeat protein|nr:HEAT repeat domain-containing protein [Acidobacteriaceae bacterium]
MHISLLRACAAGALCLLLIGSPLASSAQHPDPDGQIVASASDDESLATNAPSADAAWSLLSAAAAGNHTQTRIQALAALGTMGTDAHAAQLIRKAMDDPDLDVRTAALLAAVASGNRTLLPSIRAKLRDSEPQVVFTAATTLWKLHDKAGKDILIAVTDGNRKATPGLMHGANLQMNRELHDPAALAHLGLTSGASMLLGPFGFGITAIEYMRKNGGISARAAAIDLLSEDKGADVRKELLEALDDKDPAVRAAAAKGLGQRHEAALAKPLGQLFADPKLPVRLTAAAAFLNSSHRPSQHGTRLPS